MITRSKLVEQLIRDYQIRSQRKCPALIIFSPKPRITSRGDVAEAIFWALLFSTLVLSSYFTLYFRHFWLSLLTMGLGISIPVFLRSSRQTLTKKRESLPLSM
ncbi:hypothetical protein SLEP1_g8022 [Rubroshorea leprosula]|uniref:Uncharacterized protein n=1 Tax=Rubroshorea leprosula TaxID=152421 RepID=A0AAV5I9D1_9ROSI|nr:hypothetical protein SLEP1_g8022 [Rubroshorea leprosula]